MAKKRRAAILPTNIILLQNVVRRDPESYHEEFLQQFSHYESLRDLYLINPTGVDANSTTEFIDLIGFMSAEMLIQTIFPLLITSNAGQQVKQMRKQIYSTLIALLKSVNTGTKNQKLNRSTQALLFNLLEQRDNQGLWATKLTRELWRRGIWDDSRTVEIMTQAALHPDVKVAVAGARFFLGADKEREDNFEESSDEDGFDMNELRHKMQINKKTSKRGKKLEQAVKAMKKKNNSKHSATYLNFSAIHLLRDPQGFAEQMFDNHLSSKNSNKFDLDQKILFMNLISRLIGTHKLIVLGVYTFFLKYLTPKQRNVTQIMAAAAQASHDLVPPESIQIVVRKIAEEFVIDGVAAEVASAGINTIREILARAPLAIDAPLLQDLTEYKGSKSKAVMMAARSLISLYREVAPEMLLKKDRGKVASIELQKGEKSGLPQYGVENNVTSIPGIELLAKWKKEQGLDSREDEEDDANWEVDDDEDASDIEGDWIDVESDKEINISDSDDDNEEDEQEQEPEKGKAKIGKAEDNEDEVSDLELSSDDDDEDSEENKDGKAVADSEEPPTKKQKIRNENADINAEQAMNELLSSRILTPADFAKLEELRTEAGVSKIMGISNEEAVDSTSLVGKVKYKQLREERIAHAKEGKEDREKFGSRKGKRDTPHSTTNKEKARKKNFVMMIHKKAVQGKQKLSLRDRQRVLRAHITKQKKKGL